MIAHHDRLVVEVLTAACARRGVAVLGHTEDPSRLPAMYSELEPDVVVCADRLDGAPIDDVLTQLIARGARIVVLAANQSTQQMVALLGRDIMGYCSYEAGPREMADAIVAVANGAAALTPTFARSLLEEWRRARHAAPRPPALTPREREIVAVMAEGLSGKAIAARLGVTLKTIENHKVRVFEKLGVRTQAQAVSVALATGLAVSL